MNIAEWISKLFHREKQDSKNTADSTEVYVSDNAYTFYGQNDISTAVNVNSSTASFDGANFGVQNFFILPTNQTAEAPIDPPSPEVEKELESILAMEKEWKFNDALTSCKQLLEDNAISASKLSDKQKERILLRMLTIYSNLIDSEQGLAVYEKYIKAGFSKSVLLYALAFSHFFNARLHEEACTLLKEASEVYPDEFRFKAYLVLNSSIWKDSADEYNIEYLETAWKQLCSSDEAARTNQVYYAEAKLLTSYSNGQYGDVIEYYNEMPGTKTLLIHACFVKSYFYEARSIEKENGDYIERGTIDYEKIGRLHEIITSIEKDMKPAEQAFFRKSIADVYCNCLLLLDKTEDIISQNLYDQIEDDEVKKSIGTSMMLHGVQARDGVVDEMVAKVEMMRAANDHVGIIHLLWPWITEQEYLDTYFKVNLLIACVNSKSNERFVEILDWLRRNNEYVEECQIPEAVYLFDNGGKQKALSLLETLFSASVDPHLIINIVSISTQMGEYSFAFDLLTRIKMEKAYVFEICTEGYFSQFYFAMEKLEKKEELLPLLQLMEENGYDGKEYFLAQFSISSYSNDCKTKISAAEKLYELTNNPVYLIAATETRIMSFDLQGAGACLIKLRADRSANRTDVLMLSTRHAILASDYESAQKYAKEAKDIETDHPASPAHAFFVAVSLRTGHIEDMGYLYEYASLYPSDRHRTWFKSITAFQKNETGEDVLTDEAKALFTDIAGRDKQLITDYEKSPIGLAIIKNKFGWRYSAMRFLLRKLKVFSGDRGLLAIELDNDFSHIVVDQFLLYFLESLDLLHLLHNAERVVIPYSVIHALVFDLLHEEDAAIRAVLTFIKTATNIAYTHTDAEQLMKFQEAHNGMFDEMPDVLAMMDCVFYSSKNECTYLYGDENARMFQSIYGGKSSSVIAYVKSTLLHQLIKPAEYGAAFLKMASMKFTFINIDCISLFYAFASANREITEDFASLIEVKIGSDILSCIHVFFYFLSMEKEHEDTFMVLLCSIIRSFDVRYGRTFSHVFFASTIEEKDPYLHTQDACVAGIGIMLSLIYDELSEPEVLEIVNQECSHIPQERYDDILDFAKRSYPENVKVSD